MKKDSIASIIKYCDRIDNLLTIEAFSEGGRKWYIKDTELLIEELGDLVALTNSKISNLLNMILEEKRKLYS